MTDVSWSDPAVERIARAVGARAGLSFATTRRDAAETGIRRAMKRVGIDDAERYLDLISRDGAVLDDLLAELTVGETYFFREPAVFDVVRDQIVPRLIERHGAAHAVRAWSAACATGEEAYSLAITLAELHDGAPRLVLGTDISRARLASARRGWYRRWSLRGVPDAVVRRYFRQQRDGYQLAPEIRRLVEFRYNNLAEDRYPAISTGIWGMDIILCRNVLIYFERDAIRSVARRLIDSLSEDGWLLLGASDPVLSDVVRCDVVSTSAGLAYRRPLARTHHGAHHAPARAHADEHALAPWTPPRRAERPAIPIDRVAEPEIAPPALAPAPAPTAPAAASDDPAHAAHAAYAARDYDRAIALARAGLARGADDAASWTVLVRALANLGRLEEAGRACASALDRHRLSAELLYLHAVLLVQGDRAADAAEAARRALYLDRRLVVAHLVFATALARLERRRDARRALENAERLLDALPPEAVVPASDGEPARRLAAMVRVQRDLLARSDA